MSDTITPSRVEPIMDPGPGPVPAPASPPATYSAEPVGGREAAEAASVDDQPVEAAPLSSPGDQLARLEDKTSRIEEKLARSEAATQRVVDRFEAASHRMSEVAQQSDLAAMRGDVKWISRRVKTLPGFAAVILGSVITAVLTAILTVVIFRYLPGTLVR